MSDTREVASFTQAGEYPAYVTLVQTNCETFRLLVRSKNELFGKPSYVDMSAADLKKFLDDAKYEGLGLLHA